ncbi:Hypothetical protein AJAP_39485 [Amycolatopsis japonica]|uniref:Uncharacterized protein n=1 Tax=Amycolatopsis japonica TaxID=208439 RepID=A0A075V2N2_9PSEU|nr:Hypothetical protein AJAP_39485 [Amycolatopsis japonica]
MAFRRRPNAGQVGREWQPGLAPTVSVKASLRDSGSLKEAFTDRTQGTACAEA